MIGLQWKLLRQRFRSTGEISGFPSRGTNRATRTPPLAVGNAGHAESPTVGEIASRNILDSSNPINRRQKRAQTASVLRLAKN